MLTANESGSWQSQILERPIPYQIVQEPDSGQPITVLRLKGLRGNRTVVSGSFKDPLATSGYCVIELNYAEDHRARFPEIATDIAKLRDDIYQHELFKDLSPNTDRDGSGHKVPIHPRILNAMRSYLDRQLQ